MVSFKISRLRKHYVKQSKGLVVENLNVERSVCVFRTLRKLYTEDVVRQLTGPGSSAETIGELESEWRQLEEDRRVLRQIFPTGDNKVS